MANLHIGTGKGWLAAGELRLVIRPEQHKTDSQGKALLREAFALLGWAVNEISEDYGLDFHVEVFQNDRSTGTAFSVEFKSSIAPDYSVRREFISQELDISNALYLAREIRHPVLLTVVDVTKRKVFWTAPQIDLRLLKSLRDRIDEKTCTVRIPVANELSSTVEQLGVTLAQIETLLASHRLFETPLEDFAASVSGHMESAAFAYSLREKGDFLEGRAITPLEKRLSWALAPVMLSPPMNRPAPISVRNTSFCPAREMTDF